MAVNIGPKIGIDGEAEFRKELNNLAAQSKALESEMKAVTSAFDENDDSQEKLAAQSKILVQQIETQEKRVELLKKGVSAATEEFGEADSRTLKWKQALYDATTQMNNAKKSADDLGNDVEETGEALQDAGDDAFSFGDALKANLTAGAIIEGVKGIADAIGGLADETAEYRQIMASLETSSQQAGYSAEETAQSYEKLYGVLGDDQTAATTVANLQAIGLEQKDLTKLTDGAIGAWAKYGDSIPIDGLSEALNETIKVGKVTGSFADVLNWAGVSEDDFNASLEDCNDTTERANKVLGFLEKQGLTKAGEAWQENNEDIVNANIAALDYKDSMAELSDRVVPITQAVQDGVNGIFEKSLELTEDVDFSGVGDAIEDGFEYLIDEVVPIVFDFVGFIIDNQSVVIGAITGIGTALVAMKAAEIITGIVTATQTAVTAIQAAKTAQELWNLAMNSNVIGVVIASVGLLAGAIVGMVSQMDTLSEAEQQEIERIQAINEESEKRRESYEQVTAAAADKAEAELAEIGRIQDLYDELLTLADANGVVKDADKDRVDFILGEMNEALGTEFELTDNQIQKYGELKQSVLDLIEARKLEILLEQAQTGYEEALANKAAAESAFTENSRILSEKRTSYAQAEADLAQYWADQETARKAGQLYEFVRDNQKRYIDLNKRVENEKAALDEAQAAYDQSQAELNRYYEDIATYEDAAALALEGNVGEAITQLERQNEGFKTAASVTGKSAEDQKRELQEQYAKSLIILENYAKEYEKGTEGYTEEGLETLKKHAEDAKREMEKVGGAIVDGTTEGIDGRQWKLNDTIDSLFNLVPDWAKDVLGIHSPSRVFMDIGDRSGEGFELGFVKRIKKANKAITNAVDGTIGAVNGTVNAGVDFSAGDAGFSDAMLHLEAQRQYGAAVMEIAASRSPGSQISNSRSVQYNGGISINVQAAPGMNINALVDEIERRLAAATERRAAVW